MNKNEKKRLEELFDEQINLRHDNKNNPDAAIKSKIQENEKKIKHMGYKDMAKRSLEAIAGLVVGAVGYNMLANASPETAEYITDIQAFLMVGGGAVCLKGIYGMFKLNYMTWKQFLKMYKEDLVG